MSQLRDSRAFLVTPVTVFALTRKFVKVFTVYLVPTHSLFLSVAL